MSDIVPSEPAVSEPEEQLSSSSAALVSPPPPPPPPRPPLQLKEPPHNAADVVFFRKEEAYMVHTLKGLRGEEPGTVHKFVSYNKFEKEPSLVPEGFKQDEKVDPVEVYASVTGKRRLVRTAPDAKHADHAHYLIHDNGGRPFSCYVDEANNGVYVYRQPADGYVDAEDYLTDEDEDDLGFYHELVKFYRTERVLIGKCAKDPTAVGNSILLKIEGAHRYAFISGAILEFTAADEITDLFSTVGPNDVPEPVGVSDHYLFMMVDRVAVPRRLFNLTQKWYQTGEGAGTFENAYTAFYGQTLMHDDGNVPFADVVTVQQRLW